MSTLVLSFGSVRSASALPLYSIANSSGEGACGILYGQVRFRIGSGNAPPSLRYSSRRRRKMLAMIAASSIASPGGSCPFQCHCSQRPLLVSEPVSSAKQLEGRRITSVMILDGSTSLYSPWFSQKQEVSVANGSITTRNLSLDSPSVSFFLLGSDASGLKPWQK